MLCQNAHKLFATCFLVTHISFCAIAVAAPKLCAHYFSGRSYENHHRRDAITHTHTQAVGHVPSYIRVLQWPIVTGGGGGEGRRKKIEILLSIPKGEKQVFFAT